MAGKARLIIPEVPYHITARANKGNFILGSEKNKELYCAMLQEYAAQNKVKIYAWCIMGNHVNFVMEPSDEGGLSETFKQHNTNLVGTSIGS